VAEYIKNLYAWHLYTERDPNSVRLREDHQNPKLCVIFEDTRYEVYEIPSGQTAEDVLHTYIQIREEEVTYEEPDAGVVGPERPYLV
jgi:hypothetical protein